MNARGPVLMLVMFLGWAAVAEAGTLSVAGSGGMISLTTRLAEAYMRRHPADRIEVAQKSIESTGGIHAAAAGRIGMGMSARPLKPAEETLGLEVREIARVPLVFGVNASVPLEAITAAQACAVYRGEITDWSALGGGSGRILVLTRPDGDSTKLTLRKQLACFRDLREPDSVVIMPKSADMKRGLAGRSGSIGMLDMVGVGDARGAIRALRLDGKAPGDEGYPLYKRFFLVTKGAPAGPAARFLGFIASEEGARLIRANRAVPVRR